MKKTLLLLFSALLLTGCTAITDFFSMSAPTIMSHTPDNRQVNATAITGIRIQFSKEMDRTSTERAFSLTRNGSECPGSYTWEDRTLVYAPFEGFLQASDYVIQCTTVAEDVSGNSLSIAFSFHFTTRSEIVPPTVLSIQPVNGTVLAVLTTPVVIEFSESITAESFYKSFSITPAVTGVYSANAARTLWTFTPGQSYDPRIEYRIDISTRLSDDAGNTFMAPFYSFFSTGPRLELAIVSVTGTHHGAMIDTAAGFLNEFIEKDETFTIVFNREVPLDDSSSIISLSPTISSTTQWSMDYTQCTLAFTSGLEPGRIYALSILDRYWQFIVNGPRSTRPQVMQILFCQDSSLPTPVFNTLTLGGTFAITNNAIACFDVYIHRSPDAENIPVDYSSFLEAFSLTASNSCARFTFLSAEANPVSPAPVPPGTDVTVMRMYVRTETGTNPVGIITVTIDTSLSDTNNNHAENDYTLILNKSG